MREVLRELRDMVKELTYWISGHTNKVTEFIRLLVGFAVLTGWLDWPITVQIAFLMVVSAFCAMFTEGGTISKQRVGERIDEEVTKATNGGTTTGTGSYRRPQL